MVISCAAVAVLGYVFNVVLAYAATDIDTIFDSPLGQPLGAILVFAMGNIGLAKFLWICTVVSNFGVVFVNNTAGTRVYFAYARDGALPAAKWLSHINTVTKTPMNATLALSTVFALLGLISLGSTNALRAFFSGSSLAGATAYLMPILMRYVCSVARPPFPLLHAVSGAARNGTTETNLPLRNEDASTRPIRDTSPAPSTSANGRSPSDGWQWHGAVSPKPSLPDHPLTFLSSYLFIIIPSLSFLLIYFSSFLLTSVLVYAVFVLPLFSFPSTPNPDVNSFNWCVGFYLGLLCLVLPWYFISARKWFKGPGERDHPRSGVVQE